MSASGGVPLKKRRVSNMDAASNNNNNKMNDVDVISIPDDDSSFSSASSAFKDDDEDEDYDDFMKIPARDHSQDTSVGSAGDSPTWNTLTQPSASALKTHQSRKKKRTTSPTNTANDTKAKDKKRKVSMSPAATADSTTAAATKATKKKTTAPVSATAKASKKTATKKATATKKEPKTKQKTAIEKEMELLDPKVRQRTREEMIASFDEDDDSDDDDDLLTFAPFAKKHTARSTSPLVNPPKAWDPYSNVPRP